MALVAVRRGAGRRRSSVPTPAVEFLRILQFCSQPLHLGEDGAKRTLGLRCIVVVPAPDSTTHL